MSFLKITSLICLFFCLSISSFSQEAAPPAEPGQPAELMAMMHAESEMMRDVNILNDLYHDDVQIYALPDKLLATGKEEAIKYWEERYKKQGELAAEVLGFIEGDNTVAVKIRRTDHSTNKTTVSITLLQIFQSKIYRVYF